jgi:putative transposase
VSSERTISGIYPFGGVGENPQHRWDKKAAKKFFKKLLKGLKYAPRVVITDKLKSYGAAKREILPGVERRQSETAKIQGAITPQTRRPTTR